MTDAFMTGSIIVGAANALLAAALLAAYAGTFARTKAPFTLALLVFSGAFLTQNALVVFSYLDMMPLIPNVFTPFLLGIGILEAAGLGAMLWTATR